jgi:hypothetical protein
MGKKFKDLTEEDIDLIRDKYKNRGINGQTVEQVAIEIANLMKVSERTVRKWYSTKLNLKEKKDIESEQYVKAKDKQFDKTKKRFIITFAQNATKIHEKFFNNIKAYANFIDADIHIIAGRYRNPTSVWSKNNETDEWWDSNLLPYLDANRHNIHKYVSILSDVKIQPTAVNPMNGMQGLSGINSCVFGSPKLQMEMIPVLEGNKPKMMLTTGAVTLKNYTDSKAGKKGEFHHTFGFVVVEIKDNETFFIRQVTTDDKSGSFTDLVYRVENSEVNKINTIEGIVLGDLHCGHHDESVLTQTDKFLYHIKPKHVVLHDVFDGDSINHHTMKDPFIQYGKEFNGTNDLSVELDNMMTILGRYKDFENVIIVRSNHDDFLDRWLKNEDWKKQPTFKNAPLYMGLSSKLLEQHAKYNNKVKGIIPELINDKFPNYITLGRNSSYKIKGYECGLHGDIASNGSRGSVENFRKLNTKMIVGHMHSPSRKDGVLCVGTSTNLRVGYNVGPSSWLQSHVIIHTDGRAQHVNFINGEFTTFNIED